MRLREGGEVPQATQLVNIQGRGPNQQLEGLGEGRGHLQLDEEGSQKGEQSVGGKKAFFRQGSGECPSWRGD